MGGEVQGAAGRRAESAAFTQEPQLLLYSSSLKIKLKGSDLAKLFSDVVLLEGIGR